MDKINFQNLPNTTTPVNATNLNQLQTNVEAEFAANKIETTTNTNGTAVKFANGTMICSYRGENLKTGATYGEIKWYYPAVFIEKPVTTVSIGNFPLRASLNNVNADSSDFIIAKADDQRALNQTIKTITCIAIGRWK